MVILIQCIHTHSNLSSPIFPSACRIYLPQLLHNIVIVDSIPSILQQYTHNVRDIQAPVIQRDVYMHSIMIYNKILHGCSAIAANIPMNDVAFRVAIQILSAAQRYHMNLIFSCCSL